MSGGLAPSKSTIYVGNIPFSLTNNDLHKVFEKYGQVVKVTIMKDKVTRLSKGVAFILFLNREAAYQAVRAVNNTTMFGRQIKCSIAKDNGRASEFIRRKVYKDKSVCYECGEEGHLSYNCPSNLLGDREPPPKKEKKRKSGDGDDEQHGLDEEEEEEDSDRDDPRDESLAAAIMYQQNKVSEEAYRFQMSSAAARLSTEDLGQPKRKKYKKDAYFSDEEELDD